MEKRWNRFFIGILSSFCIIGSLIPVSAKGETIYEDFDKDRKGSITLYKYVSNDNSTVKTDGSSFSYNVDEQLEAIQKATGNYKMLPEKGVEFSYIKIADAEQVNLETKSGVYYTNMEADVLDKLVVYGGLQSATDTTALDADKNAAEKHYEPDQVVTALSKLNTSVFEMNIAGNTVTGTGETFLRQKAADTSVPVNGSFKATNAYGKTKVDNLDTGLYLIAEVNWEHKAISKHDGYWETVTVNQNGTADAGEGSEYADIASPSSPFILQLPMVNMNNTVSGDTTYAAGQGWLYDVSAYPKNGTINIHKDIITNDAGADTNNTGMDTVDTETLCDFHQTNYLQGGSSIDSGSHLTHQIDANIGDTVSQVISADVPALMDNKKNKVFSITDRMTKGLEFKSLESVTLGTEGWNGSNNTVLNTDDYVLSIGSDKKSFSVTLSANGLAKLDSLNTASFLYVRFNSFVTKDALIGTDHYDYTTDKGEVSSAANQNTAKLTYATDRTMEHEYYSNTPKVYTYEIDLNKNVKNKGNGKYEDVTFTVKSYRSQTVGSSLTETDLRFIEESSGVYRIYNENYDVGGTPVSSIHADGNGNIRIKGLDSRDYVFTETKTMNGQQLLAEPFTVRLVANKIVDEYDTKYETGALSHAYVWSGEEPAKLFKYDLLNTNQVGALSSGIAKVTVMNSGLKLLRTGGNGTIGYIAIGGLMIVSGLIFMRRRKGELNE